MKLFQVDAPYACAGVLVEDGIIIGGAPIFHRLVGQEIRKVGYKVTEVKEKEEPNSTTVPKAEA